MRDVEKNEIANLPEKYRPMSAWAYWGLGILYAVPILGFIFIIIHSFNSGNINRRSFARSYFCTLFLILIIVVIIISLGGFGYIVDSLMN